MSGSLSVSPQAGAELPSMGQMVLQAYGSERAILEGLRAGDLTLVNGSKRIVLGVQTPRS